MLEVYTVQGEKKVAMAGNAAEISYPGSSYLTPGNVGAALDELDNEKSAGLAAITASVGDAATAEVVVVSATIPANSLQVGTTFRIFAGAVIDTDAAPGTQTMRVRIGATTLTGTIIYTRTATYVGNSTNDNIMFQTILTNRSISGSATSWIGSGVRWNQAALITTEQLVGTDQSVTAGPDPAGELIIEMTYQASDAGTVADFHVATIELVKP